MSQHKGPAIPGDQSEGRSLTLRVRSVSGALRWDRLSIALGYLIAFGVLWSLQSPLAGFLLTAFALGLVRPQFLLTEIEVEKTRLTFRTHRGYSRVVSLEGLLQLGSYNGVVGLTPLQGEPVQIRLGKRSARTLVSFLVTELDLVPAGRHAFEERGFAQAKAAHLRPGGRLVCPRCERERPSEYWFQTPEGVVTEVCNECSTQATAQLATG